MFKAILTGCGGMAKSWVEYVLTQADTELVALVDIREESARAMAARYNLTCPTFTDLGAALAATSANLVLDVTIPDSHYQIVTTALAAGCHVLGEKPMAASLEQAKAMVSAAERAGRTYAVMQNRRYLKQIRACRQLLAAGTIGRPGFIAADFFLGPHFGGFRDAMESPLILDMAIHTFDQARFISGLDPISVYCYEFNPPGSWYAGNAAAVCIFEMADGSVFNYRGSWCAEGAPTAWEGSWRVTGERGTLIWDGRTAPYAEVIDPASAGQFVHRFNRVESELTWTGQEGHRGCFDEMWAALREGRRAETDCLDNIKSVAMVYGAIESARTGRKVAL